MEKKLAANQLQLNQLHQNVPDSIIKYSFVKPFRDVLCPTTICVDMLCDDKQALIRLPTTKPNEWSPLSPRVTTTFWNISPFIVE